MTESPLIGAFLLHHGLSLKDSQEDKNIVIILLVGVIIMQLKPSVRMSKDWWIILAIIKKIDKEAVLVKDILKYVDMSHSGLRNKLNHIKDAGLLTALNQKAGGLGNDLKSYTLTELAIKALTEFDNLVTNESDADLFYIPVGCELVREGAQEYTGGVIRFIGDDPNLIKSRINEHHNQTTTTLKTMWNPHARSRSKHQSSIRT